MAIRNKWLGRAWVELYGNNEAMFLEKYSKYADYGLQNEHGNAIMSKDDKVLMVRVGRRPLLFF